MKVLLITILSLLVSTSIYSKQVSLKLASTLKKGTVSTIQNEITVHAKMNQFFKIPTSEENPFEFNIKTSDVTYKNQNYIKLEGKVLKLEDGKMKLISSPEILVKAGQEATFTVENSQDELFELKVTAKHIK